MICTAAQLARVVAILNAHRSEPLTPAAVSLALQLARLEAT